jgi:hypothetical protein
MFMERATAKGFLLAPAERNMSWFLDHYRKPKLWSEQNSVRYRTRGFFSETVDHFERSLSS